MTRDETGKGRKRRARSGRSRSGLRLVHPADFTELQFGEVLVRLLLDDRDQDVGDEADLDPQQLGAGRVLIVMVTLDKKSDDALDHFNEAVCRIPELQSCPVIAGNFDHLLKVRTHDIAPCRAVPGHKIGKLPNVHQTHSFVAMELVKDVVTVPVPLE